MIRLPSTKTTVAELKASKPSSSNYQPVKERKKPGRKKGWNLALEASPGYQKPKGASKGSVPMSLPESFLPMFCSQISANGTSQRMDIINEFIKDHPETSARQATIKFAELTTKDKPQCVALPGKKSGKGRSVIFYLRPRFYHMLPEAERPDGWEGAAQADEVLWQEECQENAKAKAGMDQNTMAEDKSGESDDDTTQNSISEMNSSVLTNSTFNGYESDESERPMKKLKT